MKHVLPVVTVLLLSGCSAEVATTAATAGAARAQEARQAQQTMEQVQQRLDTAVQANQLKLDAAEQSNR